MSNKENNKQGGGEIQTHRDGYPNPILTPHDTFPEPDEKDGDTEIFGHHFGSDRVEKKV